MRRAGYLPHWDGVAECRGGRGRIKPLDQLKILLRPERDEQRRGQGDGKPRHSFTFRPFSNRREKHSLEYFDGKCNQQPDIGLLRLWSPEADARCRRKLFPVPVVQGIGTSGGLRLHPLRAGFDIPRGREGSSARDERFAAQRSRRIGGLPGGCFGSQAKREWRFSFRFSLCFGVPHRRERTGTMCPGCPGKSGGPRVRSLFGR